VEGCALGPVVVGVDVGVELALGVGALVAVGVLVALGLGEAEWLRLGRTRVTGRVVFVSVWCGCTRLTGCGGGGAGEFTGAGGPATPMPTRPVTVPAATLAAARASVVRSRRPP
jgi:hypothetical protein